MNTQQDKLIPCHDCRMMVSPDEYHPQAACMIFKATRVISPDRAALMTRRLLQDVVATQLEWEDECVQLHGGYDQLVLENIRLKHQVALLLWEGEREGENETS
jgi:hypothetical protein